MALNGEPMGQRGRAHHGLCVVFSMKSRTSVTFSPILRLVHRIIRGSCRMIVFKLRNVVGEASNCIVQ